MILSLPIHLGFGFGRQLQMGGGRSGLHGYTKEYRKRAKYFNLTL
jgi:hypothetical protein